MEVYSNLSPDLGTNLQDPVRLSTAVLKEAEIEKSDQNKTHPIPIIKGIDRQLQKETKLTILEVALLGVGETVSIVKLDGP